MKILVIGDTYIDSFGLNLSIEVLKFTAAMLLCVFEKLNFVVFVNDKLFKYQKNS